MKRGGVGVTLIALAGSMALSVHPALATPPGVNGPIVWQSQTGTSGGLNEIWIMNPDGSGQAALTDNAVNDERPAISADGGKVAFQSYRAGDGSVDSWEIYLMNSGGGAQTPLMDNDDTDFTPAFAPDGSKLVFMRQTTGQPSPEVAGQDLWTMSAEGGGEVNLTNTPIAYEAHPEYSPDGSKIAFVNSGHVDGDPQGPYDSNNIWVMNANGTGQTKLTFDEFPAGAIEPTWSPDGTQIAFTRYGSSAAGLWLMDADGTDPVRISELAVQYPVFSPDGERIAGILGNDVVTMASSAPVTPLTPLTSTPSTQDEYPAWAPAPGGGLPDTLITRKPKATVTSRRVTYEFTAQPSAGASFACKLDAKPYKPCVSPKKLSRLAKGKHKFKVKASNASGADPTPASDSFKVK